jgi:hypothetical protein
MDGDVLPGKSKVRDLAPSTGDGCVVYGVVVYLVMNLVVLPLPGVAHPIKAATLASRTNGVLAVVLFIGLTISLLIRRNTLSG